MAKKTQNRFFGNKSPRIWNWANLSAAPERSRGGASYGHRVESGGPLWCGNGGLVGPLASVGRFAPGRN